MFIYVFPGFPWLASTRNFRPPCVSASKSRLEKIKKKKKEEEEKVCIPLLDVRTKSSELILCEKEKREDG